ncbi:pyridoxamine 5'-phosphate oxidase family protein [Streptomyces sp. NPDC049910]|uniref:pyridoxamine 5'-phosphate oxidase family protein n=1 Tax=Streptomyces sp. NPDC049910 TaxID=3155278 RepID=UPI00342713F9
MRAHLGDRLVIQSPATGATRREGEIVGLRHEDGTPPYDVRWSDTDEVTLVFPGADARVRRLEHPEHPPGAAPPLSGPGTDVPGAEAAGGGAPGTAAGAVPGAPGPGGPPGPGGIGARLAAARERQGLTRVTVAGRAAMAPEYLAYLEERPADPGPGALARLAGALGTSVEALRGGGTDLPPGQGRALLRPRLRELGTDECRARLSTHGVGRVAVTTPDGPAVVPVNYEVIDDRIAFRSAPGSVPAAAAGTEVAFEVDHLDETASRGWSVLVVGPARHVTEPGAVRRLAEGAHTRPWAGGEREMWVSIRPRRITGRRIDPAGE